MQIAPHYINLVACFWMFIHMFIYKEIAIYVMAITVSVTTIIQQSKANIH